MKHKRKDKSMKNNGIRNQKDNWQRMKLTTKAQRVGHNGMEKKTWCMRKSVIAFPKREVEDCRPESPNRSSVRYCTHCAKGLQRANTLIFPFMSSIMFQYFLRSTCSTPSARPDGEGLAKWIHRNGLSKTYRVLGKTAMEDVARMHEQSLPRLSVRHSSPYDLEKKSTKRERALQSTAWQGCSALETSPPSDNGRTVPHGPRADTHDADTE